MSIGLLGKKIGMTRVFNDEGVSLPVSVMEILPNFVTQIKNKDTDGYNAVQITTGNRKASRINKAISGHLSKAKLSTAEVMAEFRIEQEVDFELGEEISMDIFEEGQKVDITGISRGFGFQGGIKRHNFRGQDNSHGNSISHRANGSIGQCQTPGRVFKGKKMSGHMGNARITTQNLEVIKVNSEKRVILVKGAVPGSKGGNIIINHSVKSA